MVLGNAQTTVVFVQHSAMAVHHVASRLPYRLDRGRRSNAGVVVARQRHIGQCLRAATRSYSLQDKSLRAFAWPSLAYVQARRLTDKVGAEDGLRPEA